MYVAFIWWMEQLTGRSLGPKIIENFVSVQNHMDWCMFGRAQPIFSSLTNWCAPLYWFAPSGLAWNAKWLANQVRWPPLKKTIRISRRIRHERNISLWPGYSPTLMRAINTRAFFLVNASASVWVGSRSCLAGSKTSLYSFISVWKSTFIG